MFTQAPDYGIAEVLVDGDVVGDQVDGYRAQGVGTTDPLELGTVELSEGAHELTAVWLALWQPGGRALPEGEYSAGNWRIGASAAGHDDELGERPVASPMDW